MAEEKPAEKKSTAAKKPAAKKSTTAKSATSKSSTSKSTAAKKPAAKKPAAKAGDSKSATKSTAAKSTTAKSTAAKKPAAKAGDSKPATKSTATKSTTAKSTAAKKPAAKSADSKSAAKSSTTKSTAAKKSSSAQSEGTEDKVTTLKMHHLRPAPGAHTRKTRVGRGESGKRGKTAGRGTKGTGARYQVPDRFEGGQTPIHMRIPKLRGFRSPFKVVYQVVNLDQIAELFPKGGKVSKEDLVAKGAVRKNRPVKVLGDGELNVKITLTDVDKISQTAKSKIESAGGSVNQG